MAQLAGRHIIVTGGTPKEAIDGVRHYANHARPDLHGLEVAKLLAAADANVTFFTPPLRQAVDNIHVISSKPDGAAIISAHDLIEAVEYFSKVSDDVSAVLHLANISSIRPLHISGEKLKIKKDAGQRVALEVTANINARNHLQAAFPDIPVIGYRGSELTPSPFTPLIENARLQAVTVLPPPALAKPVQGELSGKKIIISSGPTAEQLTLLGDVITNFSTGKQGCAIAEALAVLGAEVILVSGSTQLADPSRITTLHAVDARDMLVKVLNQLPADAYIGVAAVADFAMEQPIDLHLQEGEVKTLNLVQTPDILQSVGTHPALRPRVVIGFAAETAELDKLLEYARNKLERKGADAICANQVGPIVAGRGEDMNQITWITAKGPEFWEVMDKQAAGRAIARRLARML